jgi:DNA-binding transcriptional regulator YiaG
MRPVKPFWGHLIKVQNPTFWRPVKSPVFAWFSANFWIKFDRRESPHAGRARQKRGVGQSVNFNMQSVAENIPVSGEKEEVPSVVNLHPQGTQVISPPDEVHAFLGQRWHAMFANCIRPTDKEIRRMLLEMRRRFRWSRGFAAAVLGVTMSTIEKWERGRRKPRGPARKLIWLLHSQLILKDGKVKNCWDLATWGEVPCRDSIETLSLILATIFVSTEECLAMLEAYDSQAARAARESCCVAS